MKNRKFLYALLVILGIATVYVIIDSQNKSTIRKDLRDFAIEDTSRVGKVIISDKIPTQVTLTRSDNGKWKVNESLTALQPSIKILLTTLNQIEVKSPVAESMKPNVLKNLSTTAKKVEIFDNEGKEIKTVFIGGPTQDHMGTFAMIEGAEAPFVIYIPGFNGYLSTRFFTSQDQWRDRTVINIDNRQIANIQLEYPTRPQESFSIEVNSFEDFTLRSAGDVVSPDTLAVQRYLGSFRNLNFEGLVAKGDKVNQDSLLNSTPFFVLSVTNISGQTKTIRGFKKANTKNHTEQGVLAPYDVDRFYGEIEPGKLAILQYYQFDKVLKERSQLKAKFD